MILLKMGLKALWILDIKMMIFVDFFVIFVIFYDFFAKKCKKCKKIVNFFKNVIFVDFFCKNDEKWTQLTPHDLIKLARYRAKIEI